MKTTSEYLIAALVSSSLSAGFTQGDNYWQQFVSYEIHVTLNDSAHTLSAHETLTYTNHSPDTLNFIWFHLWPNAYKNNKTAFARQKLEHYSTRFFYAKEEDRGYIDSLDFMIDGHSLRWEYHPEWIDVAQVFLPEPLAPDSNVTIETPFYVKLPIVFSRLGHTEKHYEITQWYPKPAVYDAEGWHPMPYLDMGEFYSEFGSFDVYITLPKEYRIMATGTLVDGEEEYRWLDSLAIEGDALHALDKREFKKSVKQLKKDRKRAMKKEKKEKTAVEERPLKTLHFFQENVHDFAWFADRHWIVRKGELWLADSTRKVTLWSMYLPKNAKLWENSIEYIHDAGYWYSIFYGDYPYNHISAVDGDLSAGGGMEYPNITIISSGGSKDMLEFVIMHEVGHNWFYGILGSNERDHAWMDEGVNEYANIRYWEKKYPQRDGAFVVSDFVQNKLGIARNLGSRWVMGYLGYQIRAVRGDDQPIEMTSTDFERNNYGFMIYYKTAIFMRFLQHYLGEEKIDEIMQDFYENWKFRHPLPDDFKSFFTKHVNDDLDWFFDDAINNTKVIDYAVSSLKDGQVLVKNIGSMAPPVELAFFRRDGTEIKRQWISGFEGSRTISVPNETEKVLIDPDNYMPDINRENNTTSKPLKFNFVFDQPTFHHFEMNLLPWFGWNAYNGTTPGIFGYSGFIPGYRYGFSFSPQWDFENKKPVGSFRAQRTFYQLLGFRTLTVSGKLSDYSGRQGGKVALSGTIRNAIDFTPSISLNAALYYHDIQTQAVDSIYYTPGTFTVTNMEVFYSHRPNPFIRYKGGIGFMLGTGEEMFSRFHLTGDLSWRYHKKLTLKARGWVGSFIISKDIPAQYRTWMSGGVDPNFQNTLILNRTDNDKSRMKIYDEQFILDGPALRGITSDSSLATAWGINFDQSIPFIPLNLFADIAGATDIDEFFFDAGLKLSLGIIHLYLPLYQSWDDKKTVTGFEQLKKRTRFEFSLSSSIQINL